MPITMKELNSLSTKKQMFLCNYVANKKGIKSYTVDNIIKHIKRKFYVAIQNIR